MDELLTDLQAFRDARGWARYHTPRNLAEAIAVESGELLQCFLWGGLQGSVEQELADVLIFALTMCIALDVHPEALIRAKIEKNAQKYPVGHAVPWQSNDGAA